MSETKNLQARVPADLHQKLRLLALIQKKTVTDLVIEVLADHVQRHLGTPTDQEVSIVLGDLAKRWGGEKE